MLDASRLYGPSIPANALEIQSRSTLVGALSCDVFRFYSRIPYLTISTLLHHPRTLTPRHPVAGSLVATTTLTMLSHILISTLVLSIAAAPTSLGDAKEAVSECPAPCLEFVPHNLSTTRPRCTIPTAVRSDGGGSHRRRPLHRRPRLRHLRHRLLRLRHLRLR